MLHVHHLWGSIRYYYFNYVHPHPTDFSADEVFPRLWVGDLTAAFDLPGLQRHHITHVVNVVPGIPTLHEPLHYLNIPCLDAEDYNMSAHFANTNAFITDALKDPSHNVLVHCSVGRSRSVTVAMAYHLSVSDDSVKDTLMSIQHKRPMAQPNDGFMKQLHAFHTCGAK